MCVLLNSREVDVGDKDLDMRCYGKNVVRSINLRGAPSISHLLKTSKCFVHLKGSFTMIVKNLLKTLFVYLQLSSIVFMLKRCATNKINSGNSRVT